MTMFPHTITLYIITEDQVTFEQVTNITVLEGVLLDAAKAANVRSSGMENADAVTVYIPFSVQAYDGQTAEIKRYVSRRNTTPPPIKAACGRWILRRLPMFLHSSSRVRL